MELIYFLGYQKDCGNFIPNPIMAMAYAKNAYMSDT